MAGDKLLVTPVDSDGLRVRSGPGTEHDVVTTSYIGEGLEVREERETAKAKIGQEGQWLHIENREGEEGFVAAWFVRRAYTARPGEAPPPPEEPVTPNPRLTSSPRTSLVEIPSSEQKNLLQNSVFDANTYEQVLDGNTNIPEGWTAWWGQPAKDECYDFKPNFGRLTRAQAPDRVHAGNHVAFYYTPWSSHHAGYYQTVDAEPDTVYRYTIWGHAWSSSGEPKSTATTKMWVGIDPAGGTDPLADGVIWGPETVAMDKPHQFMVEAKAVGSKLTVFTRSRPDWCMEHNNVFWDDASLVGVARETADENVEEITTPRAPSTTPASSEPLVLQTSDGDTLNVRDAPDGAKIGRISGNDRVKATDPADARAKLGQEGQWVEVILPDGTRGWAAAWFLKEAAKVYKFPFGHALVGLHGPADPASWAWDEAVYGIIKKSQVDAVKMLSAGDLGADQVKRLNQLGVNFIMARLFGKFETRRTPQDFVNEVMEPTKRLYKAGVRYFEVHNEPNLHHKDGPEGMWVVWQNGKEFGDFFLATVALLRPHFPEAKFGWPGLSPGLDVNGPDGKPLRYSSQRFEDEAAQAMQQADFICMHTYWGADGSPYTRSLDDLRRYAARFPDKAIIASEFSNASPNIDKNVKGQEYQRFYKEARNLPSNVAALFSYVASASWGYTAETWKDSSIPDLVAQR